MRECLNHDRKKCTKKPKEERKQRDRDRETERKGQRQGKSERKRQRETKTTEYRFSKKNKWKTENGKWKTFGLTAHRHTWSTRPG
jgi:hypothetical protein